MMKALKRVVRYFVLTPMRGGRMVRTLRAFPRFVRQWSEYRSGSSEEVKISGWYPCLDDATATTPFDPHYFYQSGWAAAKIAAQRPRQHVDVGSQINLIAPLSGFVNVEFVDIRPLVASLPRLHSVKGSVLNLPYPDASVRSLSSLHVVEHIGLGRYGDPLDPQGSEKACAELQRVLGRGGHLYFSLPVGRERVEFNAHRIHAPQTIVRYFDRLQLVDFCCVDDDGVYRESVALEMCAEMTYGLGLFHFKRPARK